MELEYSGTVDTAVYADIYDAFGKVTLITNRGDLYGYSANTFRIRLINDAGAVTLSSDNTWTGTQTFASIAVTRLATIDTAIVETKLTVTGDTAVVKSLKGLTGAE